MSTCKAVNQNEFVVIICYINYIILQKILQIYQYQYKMYVFVFM